MDDVEITVCPPNTIRPALEILFASRPAVERHAMVESLCHDLRDDATARQGLFTAMGRDGVHGTVLVQQQAGGTALVWPPGTRPIHPDLERMLAEAADRHVAQMGASMAQALFVTHDDPAITILKAVGFEPLTELAYLVASAEPPAPQTASQRLAFEPYDASQRSRLATLIEETYRDTHDCPRLNGVRSIDDVITGYQGTGKFDPTRWFFVRRGTRDVGLIILAEHEPACQWELVYMGVVPHVRQQGVGKAMVRFALRTAFEAGAESLLLAMDATNRPAARLYRRCGFREWNRRLVYWKRYGLDSATGRRMPPANREQ